MTEHQLKGAVDKLLKAKATATNSLTFRKNWGGRYGTAHEADYTGCARGRFFALELKSPQLETAEEVWAAVTEGQKKRLKEHKLAGAEILVSNSLEEIETFIDQLLERGFTD